MFERIILHMITKLCSKSFSYDSAVCELRNSRCTTWDSKRQRNQRLKYQHSLDHEESKGVPRNIYFCFIDCAKAFDCKDHNKCRKILKRWEYYPTLSVSWETCICVNKQQLEPDMEQLTGSKLGKEYDRAVHCHPAC